jgi:hypothetical protein
MPREMTTIKREDFLSWGCSECGWLFEPKGPPVGENIEAMMDNFRSRRDREFASHVCAEHPRKSKSCGHNKCD